MNIEALQCRSENRWYRAAETIIAQVETGQIRQTNQASWNGTMQLVAV